MEILRRELPFAAIVGVDSEREIEPTLVDSDTVQPPLTLSTSVSGVQVDIGAGCLLGGAGEIYILRSLKHTLLNTSQEKQSFSFSLCWEMWQEHMY